MADPVQKPDISSPPAAKSILAISAKAKTTQVEAASKAELAKAALSKFASGTDKQVAVA